MRTNQRQVKFYCSEKFFKRLQAEKLKRDLSLQRMIMDALELYIQNPTEWDRSVWVSLKYDRQRTQDSESMLQWLALCSKYEARMTPEKLEVMEKAMEWDLKMQKSSRRKTSSIRKKTSDGRAKHEQKAPRQR